MAKEQANITYKAILSLMEKPGSRIHFIGVGGISMYSLASLCAMRALRVSGSDVEESERTAALRRLGVEVKIGHTVANSIDKDLVVYTHAISESNPELLGALRLGIPTVSRAHLLGAIMTEYKNRIGVSGSHGKSTTLAMLDSIFSLAGRNPTVLSGAALESHEPFRIGGNDTMIYEGCEYKDSFLSFLPTVFMALNLEHDHPDYFPTLADVKASFEKAIDRAPLSIINADDTELSSIARRLGTKKIITVGQRERADYRYRIVTFAKDGYVFEIYKDGITLGEFSLSVIGVFNVASAAMAVVAAIESGISPETASLAISSFRGIERRMQRVGSRLGREVYYDYAHHPTEIRETINALKMHTGDTLTVIFKPHTYSRTKALWKDFCSALSLADSVILTDIYPAREEKIEGVSSERLAKDVGVRAIYASDSEVVSVLDKSTHGAIVIMGAGNLDRVKYDILNK